MQASHRLDPEYRVDLIEEVARVIGYEKIPLRDEISIRLAPKEPDEATIETIRESLIGAGYFESLTFSFVSDNLAEDFRPEKAAGLLRAEASVRAADAKLRPSIIPGLPGAVRHNESNGTMGAHLLDCRRSGWTRMARSGAAADCAGGWRDYRATRGGGVAAHRLNGERGWRLWRRAAGICGGACGRFNGGRKSSGISGGSIGDCGEVAAARR